MNPEMRKITPLLKISWVFVASTHFTQRDSVTFCSSLNKEHVEWWAESKIYISPISLSIRYSISSLME